MWYPFSSHYWRPKPADAVTALQQVLQQQQQQQQQQHQSTGSEQQLVHSSAAASRGGAASAAAAAGAAAAGLSVDSDVAAEEAAMRDLLLQRTGISWLLFFLL
jgi:TolA-binding protein